MRGECMHIEVYSNAENSLVFKISGRIDAVTSVALEEQIRNTDFQDRNIVFDFENVQYISSSGLRQLLVAKKKAKGSSFRIINVNEAVNDVLSMTGLDSVFDIEAAPDMETTFTHSSIKDFLEAKYKSCPEKVFLLNDDTTYTWEEIYYAVQIIAFDLYRMGVRKGTHVGLCSTNSINWVLAFFAVQKLGGIACLLNFGYTETEFHKVLSVGDITHFVYGDIPSIAADEENFLNNLPANTQVRNVYCIKSSVDFKSRLHEYQYIEGLFSEKADPDDASVMIYTSGSSGTPKGVILSAFNIFNSAEGMKKVEKLTGNDRLCFITPLFHILGLSPGLFECAICDCQMFFPKDIRTNTVLTAIEEHKCTAFRSVPTMMLAIINNAAFDTSKVGAMKTCVLAGAPAPEAQLVRMQNAFPNTKFFNAYGLSEMAPVSITDYDTPIEQLAYTCGKPIDHITVQIQDIATKEECATGVDGEIIIKGSNMMACYYKLDLDSQAIDSEGYIHTGDLGNIDAEGKIHITGRLKELIIRGGENIVPNELAEPIAKFEGVQDVKVVGVPHNFFGEVPCACIVMKEGYEFDEEKMRAYLATVLTKQKLPEYYYIFDKFPMLSSGKVDAVTIKKLASEKFKQ